MANRKDQDTEGVKTDQKQGRDQGTQSTQSSDMSDRSNRSNQAQQSQDRDQSRQSSRQSSDDQSGFKNDSNIGSDSTLDKDSGPGRS